MAGSASVENAPGLTASDHQCEHSKHSGSPSSTTLYDNGSQSDDGHNTGTNLNENQNQDLVGVGSWVQSQSRMAGYDTADNVATDDHQVIDLDNVQIDAPPVGVNAGETGCAHDLAVSRNTTFGQVKSESNSGKLDGDGDKAPQA